MDRYLKWISQISKTTTDNQVFVPAQKISFSEITNENQINFGSQGIIKQCKYKNENAVMKSYLAEKVGFSMELCYLRF